MDNQTRANQRESVMNFMRLQGLWLSSVHFFWPKMAHKETRTPYLPNT